MTKTTKYELISDDMTKQLKVIHDSLPIRSSKSFEIIANIHMGN